MKEVGKPWPPAKRRHLILGSEHPPHGAFGTVRPAKGGQNPPQHPSPLALLFFFPLTHFFGGALEIPDEVKWGGEGETLPVGCGHVPGTVSLMPQVLSTSLLSHQGSREGPCKSQGAFGAPGIPDGPGMGALPTSPTFHPRIPAQWRTFRGGGALFLLHH